MSQKLSNLLLVVEVERVSHQFLDIKGFNSVKINFCYTKLVIYRTFFLSNIILMVICKIIYEN